MTTIRTSAELIEMYLEGHNSHNEQFEKTNKLQVKLTE
jgi:hypothetical protein